MAELVGSTPTSSGSRDFSVVGSRSQRAGPDPKSTYTEANPSADGYYKQRMRHGFIDLRNSYNEKIKPRNVTYTRSLGGPVPSGYSGQSGGYNQQGQQQQQQQKGAFYASHGSQPSFQQYGASSTEGKPLYRSNSSLDLDNPDSHGNTPEPMSRPLHRDYGSTSSLDVKNNVSLAVGQTSGGDSFFAMLQDYHPDNRDQRAQAPPHIQDVLRGRADVEGGTRGMKDAISPATGQKTFDLMMQFGMEAQMNYNNSQGIVEDDPPSSSSQQSPKLRSKSQKHRNNKEKTKSVSTDSSSGGGGLLRKLRGKTDSSDSAGKSMDKSPSGDIDANKLDDRYRHKAFVHFDCQSMGANLVEVATRRSEDVASKDMKLKNITTGASAASGKDSTEDSDVGDGKCNDMLLSCPFFRNEIGGEEERTICLNRRSAQKRVQQLLGNVPAVQQINNSTVQSPLCNGVAVLDTASGPNGLTCSSMQTHQGLIVEYVDCGAMYYRNFFHGYDHQNFVGVDEKIGPVAISFRREKVDDKERETTTGKMEGGGVCHQYRLIVRTGELECLRGSVIEEAIPSSSRLSNTRGLPPKDVLEFLFSDELNLSSLKMASVGGATSIGEQLLKLDEQRVTKTYKVGVLLCRKGQQTEEEMYNNEHGSQAFEEFLDCIGDRVPLKGFEKYRGGLDCKTDSTGTHSLYKQIEDCEVMFHVSTMLPFTPTNRQQLLRKRHIGNDIVTIVFQEPGSLPFTPKSIRSHFQHVFIIVKVHHPNTEHVKYSLAVTRSKDVPPFGPLFSDSAMFGKSPEFSHFLAIKVINGENAVHCSDKFLAMARRTRQEYMKELVSSTAGTTSLDSASKLSKFSLGSGRRKERPKVRTVPDVFATGGVAWSVQTEDFGSSSQIEAHLGIGSTLMVLIDVLTKRVLASISCKHIIGWTATGRSLRIYYNNNECIMVRMHLSEVDEITEVVTRLSLVTRGAQTEEYTLRRNSLGQLGFHVHFEAIISEIEQHGFAWNVGLRNGARLVEICKVATCTLTHDQMIDLLRTSVTVKVVVIPPHEDGSPRRGLEARLNSVASASVNFEPPHTTHQQMRQSKYALFNLKELKPTPPDHHYPLPPMSAPPVHNRVEGQKLSPRNFPEFLSGSSLDQISHSHSQNSLPMAPRNLPAHNKHSYDSLGRASDQTDVPSEMSSASIERLPRVAPTPGQNENGGRGWSGKVTVYPAYNNKESDTPEEEHWMTQSLPARGNDQFQPPHSYHRASPSNFHRSTETVNREDSLERTRGKVLHQHTDSRSSGGDSLKDDREGRGAPRLPPKLKHSHLMSSHSAGSLGEASSSNHGSAHSSPVIPRRPLKPQEDRTAATPVRPHGNRIHKSNDTFQKELIRLIDPDVSFTVVDGEDGSPMQRTRSDDSICAAVGSSHSTRPRTHGSSDAIFGANLPVPPPRDHSSLRDHKLSPRATKDLPGTVLRVRNPARPHSAHTPMDSAEWNSLVETASKAFQDGDNSPLNDSKGDSSLNASGASDNRSRLDASPESQRERILQLEKLVQQLSLQMQQEQRGRSALEGEVLRLQDDNVRLQEESQTAAAQLRKFTEWFFNTIDRQ